VHRATAQRGPGEPAVEFEFRRLKKGWRRPKQPLRLQRCLNRLAIVPGEYASLQLPNPVPALGQSQIRLTRQVAFEAALIELLIVKTAKCRGQTTKGPDQSELRSNDVDDETESRMLSKVETLLGFTLRLRQRISRREKVRVQVIAAVGGKREVTGLARGIEGATYQVTARPDVPRPRHNEIAEAHICPGLIASQAMLLDQLISRPAELEPAS
jgi:hypothetical protein